MCNLWDAWCRTALFLNGCFETLWTLGCVYRILCRSWETIVSFGTCTVFRRQPISRVVQHLKGRERRGDNAEGDAITVTDWVVSSVLPPPSSSLSATLSAWLFLLQPIPACQQTSSCPVIPPLCHFCPLLFRDHFHPFTRSLDSFLLLQGPFITVHLLNVHAGGFKWFSGQLRIDQAHVDSPQVGSPRGIFPHILTHVKSHWYVSVCSVGCCCWE